MRILSFDRLAGYWADQNYDRVYSEVYGWSEPKGPTPRQRESTLALQIMLTA